MPRPYLFRQRRGLAFPGGSRAGFDPTHPASAGCVFSGISTGVSATNLLKPSNKPTVLVTAPTRVLDGVIGLSSKFPGTANNGLVFAGAIPATVDHNFTAACIIRPTSLPGACLVMETSDGNGGGWRIGMLTGQMFFTSGAGPNNIQIIFPVVAGVPYFLGYSGVEAGTNLYNGNFVWSRLDRGQTLSSQTIGVTCNTPTASTGHFIFGGKTFADCTGAMSCVMYNNTRALTLQELLKWSKDPWEFWYPTPINRVAFDPGFVSKISAPTTITGTLAVTETNDPLSATGDVPVIGNLTSIETNDTVAAAGNVPAVGNLALTEINDTIAAVGKVVVSGTLSATQANQTIVAAGGLVNTATLSVTQAPQTVVATGSLIVRGTLSATQAVQTLSAAGGPVVGGTLASTESLDTLSATGKVTVGGTLNANQSPQTISATGFNQNIVSTLNVTQANQTVASIGKVTVGGTLSVNQAPQTLVSAGSSTVLGTLSANQAPETLSAFGSVLSGVGGGLNVIQASQTVAAAGSVLGTIASLNVSQAPQTLTAAGIAGSITGTLSVSQAPQTLVASGAIAVRGSLNANQAPETLIASGAIRVDGSLNTNQPSETLSATGSVISGGALNVSQVPQTLTATGLLVVSGSLNVTQDSEALVASGGSGLDAALNVHQASQILVASAFSGEDVKGGLSAAQVSQVLSGYGVLAVLHPNVLKYNYVLKIDGPLHIEDWQPIADGVEQDIGIVLRVSRGDVLLACTPAFDDRPEEFTQGTYPSGEIYITTAENKVIWIKPADSNFPISAYGEILYSIRDTS